MKLFHCFMAIILLVLSTVACAASFKLVDPTQVKLDSSNLPAVLQHFAALHGQKDAVGIAQKKITSEFGSIASDKFGVIVLSRAEGDIINAILTASLQSRCGKNHFCWQNERAVLADGDEIKSIIRDSGYIYLPELSVIGINSPGLLPVSAKLFNNYKLQQQKANDITANLDEILRLARWDGLYGYKL